MFQWEILRRQLNDEKNFYSEFISDRTTLDIFSYYFYNNNDSLIMKNAYTDICLENYRNKYDLIVYVPIMFDLKDDGFRNKDEKYRYEIDGLIKTFLDENKNVYTIQSYNLEDRIKEVIEILK